MELQNHHSMKKHLKFIVAIFGITIATLGTMKVSAGTKKPVGTCSSTGVCGFTDSGATITGVYSN
jgi:hypothetical protein